MRHRSSGPHPAAHAEQATLCPSAESGWIGRARRILAVRHCLFHGITGGEVLTGLLSATQAERRRRHQPIGQDREGLATRVADSASHPNAFVPVVVSLTGTPSMANDRVVLADRTSPRQEVQGDHPGSMLSFASGSAIKRITLRVKACRWTVLLRKFRSWGWAFTLPAKSVSKEKRILLCRGGREPTLRTLAGIKRLRGSWPTIAVGRP